MIVAFSTSSRLASVALIAEDGRLLWEGDEEAPQAASGACMRMLVRSGCRLEDATLFVADLGPGSFTGVRVGVTIAKSLAFAAGVMAAGQPAFDLIATDRTVVLPSKRGEWFVRRPGSIAERSQELPSGDFAGFGPGVEPPVYPRASAFAGLLGLLVPVEPERLVPAYLIEPSISIPRKPFGAEIAQ